MLSEQLFSKSKILLKRIKESADCKNKEGGRMHMYTQSPCVNRIFPEIFWVAGSRTGKET